MANDRSGEPTPDVSERWTDILRSAAIEAELETAGHPETIEEARHNVAVRLARTAAGFALILLGVLMVPLPGPGWLVIIIGLQLLPYVWAERTIRRIRRHAPGVPEDGRIPARTWAVMGILVVAWTTAAILFGSDVRDWIQGVTDPGAALGG